MEGPETSTPPSADRVAELRRRLLAAVRRVCPPWMATHVEDIAQAAILQILQAETRSGANRKLRPSYLHRAAYTAMVDEMRRQFRRKESAVAEPTQLDGIPEGGDRAPQHTSGEIDRAIRGCMGNLVRPRRIAVACHLQGYSAPEMSRLLNWTAKKAGHLVQRGLRDLRGCLESKGVTP